MLAITRLRTFVLSRKKSAPPSYLAPRSIKSKCALLYGCNVMRNTWLVAVGCDSTAHLTSRPRGWLASILATLCVRVHPLSSCASAWPRETECVRRAECTRAARVAPSTMQIRAVTEKRIQTWSVDGWSPWKILKTRCSSRTICATTSNKEILVARPGESSSRRNYINSVSFFFPRRLYRMEGKNGSVSLAEKRDSIVDWNSYG